MLKKVMESKISFSSKIRTLMIANRTINCDHELLMEPSLIQNMILIVKKKKAAALT